ncbi:GlsB/YeaQ/YmgE family stress response membrane protein [Paractinoplanes hotanensis]|uniref:GlsB/YeaQ/YmgE family stress response membrane protein n=1 Tax=Paractinoplanes hotanensis TaxID=2906497 RepID=A0ABT0YCM8_9ACTN|nr:GlsB/YeaQ/YmgE family stress response membrane protein [Actinoplanes hotanensis]MCM4083813.1 GlsB/YeaQ/YmgE family stress response membrane protein [Actinoplanes hotanensis]
MLAGLISAVVAGTVVGLAGRLVPRWRNVPVWLPMVIGVVAALAGSLAVRAVGAEPSGGGSSVAMQLFFAAVGVVTMGAMAARRAALHPSDPLTGRPAR